MIMKIDIPLTVQTQRPRPPALYIGYRGVIHIALPADGIINLVDLLERGLYISIRFRQQGHAVILDLAARLKRDMHAPAVFQVLSGVRKTHLGQTAVHLFDAV